MRFDLAPIRPGLALVLLGLAFGIGLGIAFGVFEDTFKAYIKAGIAAHPGVHDAKSQDKIWRYAQRAHFHASGISAFSIGLVVLIMFSSLKNTLKTAASILVGIGGLYPMAWLSMFILAPSIGRSAAHGHIVTEILTFVGVGSLLLGIAILCANLFLKAFHDGSAPFQEGRPIAVVDCTPYRPGH